MLLSGQNLWKSSLFLTVLTTWAIVFVETADERSLNLKIGFDLTQGKDGVPSLRIRNFEEELGFNPRADGDRDVQPVVRVHSADEDSGQTPLQKRNRGDSDDDDDSDESKSDNKRIEKKQRKPPKQASDNSNSGGDDDSGTIEKDAVQKFTRGLVGDDFEEKHHRGRKEEDDDNRRRRRYKRDTENIEAAKRKNKKVGSARKLGVAPNF